MSQSRPGVLLAQLGGPDTLEDVRPFLFNFFVDLIPDNIPVPRPLVRPLAWLISTLRAPYSRRLYASIGGGSPIRVQTEAQARALAGELRRRGRPMPVYVAMRNWKPYTADAVRRAQADGVTHLVFMPLYPQYSYSTTRSSLAELKRVLSQSHYRPELTIVEEYCEDPKFVEAVASLCRRFVESFRETPARVHVVFSAHGLPVKYIERGDPYLDHVRRSVAAVVSRLGHPGPTHLSFQSRLGPEKWLSPSTEELIVRLGVQGAAAVCVVPIAFVSEHVETLNEIDIQYADLAKRHGIAEFRRVCALKCHPAFVGCLADQVERALAPKGGLAAAVA